MVETNSGIWHIGVDEAGYGPNLGPLVQVAVAIRVPFEKKPKAPGEVISWWDVLEKAVTRDKRKANKKLLVDDSKEVFSASKRLEGLERLENALLMLGITPNEQTLWKSLAPFWIEPADEGLEPWHDPNLAFPEQEISPIRLGLLSVWQKELAENGLGPVRVKVRMVFPKAFNRAVDLSQSKATILTDGVGQFLQWGLDMADPGERVVAVVDKLGGRDRYGAWLGSLLGGWVAPGEESLAKSDYRVILSEKELGVSFESKADQNHLPVALASMVAKYLRERHMDAFNAWWQAKVEGLVPTAGYPQDAKRFLEGVDQVREKLGIPIDVFWRQR